jgi:hypothetical protein
MLPAGVPDDLSRSSKLILNAMDREANIFDFDTTGARSSDEKKGSGPLRGLCPFKKK